MVFGEVLEPGKDGESENEQRGEGMEALEHIMKLVEVDPKNHRPKEHCRVVIEKCGEIVK